MKESVRCIVMDGCVFLNKCPTKVCLAKKKKKKKEKKKRRRKKTEKKAAYGNSHLACE